ncbi:MAG: peptidyl-alpha-hydroxyglycine alpha-amidating lyase family protein [Planctomycetales bacterium]
MSAATAPSSSIIVGSDRFRYAPVPDWPRLPPGWSFVEVVGVATDARDRVFVFSRSEHPVTIFEPDGTFVASWGEGQFVRPHGITIAPDGAVYCTDDRDHSVRKFTPEGKLLLTLGTRGKPSDTGIDGLDYRTIKRPGLPFNLPTNLAIAADGSLYVTDGYGNCRVHKFSPSGEYLFSWGEPGSGPGQFNLPHGIAIDQSGLIYVADRENSRIQLFTPEGKYTGEWTDTSRPMQVFFDAEGTAFVCDVGWKAGVFPWQTVPAGSPRGAYVSVFDRTGRRLTRWGGSENPCAPGDFFAPHDLCVDSQGSIYVGEVVMSAGGYQGKVPATCHPIQKFKRLS